MQNLPWRRKLKHTYCQLNISNFLFSNKKADAYVESSVAQKIETNIRSV